MQINWSKIGDWCKKYLLNKYLIAIIVFVVVYAFIGDQSLVRRIRRSYQIHQLERRLKQYNEASEQAQRELNLLQDPDSLTKYAREHYYMHEPHEDVYIVREK